MPSCNERWWLFLTVDRQPMLFSHGNHQHCLYFGMLLQLWMPCWHQRARFSEELETGGSKLNMKVGCVSTFDWNTIKRFCCTWAEILHCLVWRLRKKFSDDEQKALGALKLSLHSKHEDASSTACSTLVQMGCRTDLTATLKECIAP